MANQFPHIQPVFFTVTEVCEILHISRSTLIRKINCGSMPSVHCGRRLLIPRNFIETLIKEAYENLNTSLYSTDQYSLDRFPLEEFPLEDSL